MECNKKVPKALQKHYVTLKEHIEKKELKKAHDYLYELPPDTFDLVLKHSGTSRLFNPIFLKLEEYKGVKKDEFFRVNIRGGDNNSLF